MDYRKYLYWYKPDQPSFEEDLVYREIYCRIGYIFHIIQMIEYNIAMILSIEEWEKEKDAVFTMEKFEEVKKKIARRFKVLSSKKYTFGALAREVENSVYLRDLDKQKPSKPLSVLPALRALILSHRFKFCSSKLDSPCTATSE